MDGDVCAGHRHGSSLVSNAPVGWTCNNFQNSYVMEIYLSITRMGGFMGDLAACTAALRCANGRKAGNRTLSRPEADDALPYSARRREKDRALAATEPA
jgi:hypothetical protein